MQYFKKSKSFFLVFSFAPCSKMVQNGTIKDLIFVKKLDYLFIVYFLVLNFFIYIMLKLFIWITGFLVSEMLWP